MAYRVEVKREADPRVVIITIPGTTYFCGRRAQVMRRGGRYITTPRSPPAATRYAIVVDGVHVDAYLKKSRAVAKIRALFGKPARKKPRYNGGPFSGG